MVNSYNKKLEMNNATYLTQKGKQRLTDELENLKGPVRDQLAKRLRIAIQQGDLSENADYITAKEEQAFIEGRILNLENLLKEVIIIDQLPIDNQQISIGSTIIVQEEGSMVEEKYYLVGPQEANPLEGWISFESPIGKALLNHKVGDVVEFTSPNGNVKLKIIRIE